MCVRARVLQKNGTEDKLWLCFICGGNVCVCVCTRFKKKVQKTNFGYVLYVVVTCVVCVHTCTSLLIIIFKKWYLPIDCVCV